MNPEEFVRRKSNEVKVVALFTMRPSEWIDSSVFMELAGAMAWRTRISEARKILEQSGGVVENRMRYNYKQIPATKILKSGKVKHFMREVPDGPLISEYRYLPHAPLGRDAGTEVSGQRALQLQGQA